MIDVATRKVINHFVLNTPTKQYRFLGGTPDPEGKLFYAVTKEITKFPEHYEVGKPKYTVSIWNSRRSSRRWTLPRKKSPRTRATRGGCISKFHPTASIFTIRREDHHSSNQRLQSGRSHRPGQAGPPGMENIHFGGHFGPDLTH